MAFIVQSGSIIDEAVKEGIKPLAPMEDIRRELIAIVPSILVGAAEHVSGLAGHLTIMLARYEKAAAVYALLDNEENPRILACSCEIESAYDIAKTIEKNLAGLRNER